MCCASHRECAVLFLNRITHGAWGGNLTFPPMGPLFRSRVLYGGLRHAIHILEVTALAPAPAATGRLKCSVAAWCRCHVVGCRAYALSSLPPPLCSGVASPVLKRSGLSAVALAKVESTVTCLRVLPAPCALGTHGLAPCVRNCTGILHPTSGVGNSCFAAAWCRCHVVGCSFALEPPFFHTNSS